jgi:hypothetical protein
MNIEPIIATAQKARALQTITVNEFEYAHKGELEVVLPPQAAPLNVASLRGVADYLKANPDELQSPYIQIYNANRVEVKTRVSNSSASRPTHLVATADDRAEINRKCERFWAQDQMIVWLQTAFAPLGDWEDVVRIVSNATKSKELEGVDNGISQSVTIRITTKDGLASNERVQIKNPITLHPFRTFAEFEPPPMRFAIRRELSTDDSLPRFGLFLADPGEWDLLAMLGIRKWLEENAVNVPIIG